MPGLVNLLNVGGFTASVSDFGLGLQEIVASTDVGAATAETAADILLQIDNFQSNPSKSLEDLQAQLSEIAENNPAAMEVLIQAISYDRARWKIEPQPKFQKTSRFVKDPKKLFAEALSPAGPTGIKLPSTRKPEMRAAATDKAEPLEATQPSPSKFELSTSEPVNLLILGQSRRLLESYARNHPGLKDINRSTINELWDLLEAATNLELLSPDEERNSIAIPVPTLINHLQEHPQYRREENQIKACNNRNPIVRVAQIRMESSVKILSKSVWEREEPNIERDLKSMHLKVQQAAVYELGQLFHLGRKEAKERLEKLVEDPKTPKALKRYAKDALHALKRHL